MNKTLLAIVCLFSGLMCGAVLSRWFSRPSNLSSAVITTPRPAVELHSSDKQAPRNFSWRNIETDDYRKYLQNLRTIGCPEVTVEDILVADVNGLYMEKAKPTLHDLRQSLVRCSTNASATSTKKLVVSGAEAQLHSLDEERLLLISGLLNHKPETFKTANAPWAYAFKEIISDQFPYLSSEKSSQLTQLKKAAADKIKSRIQLGQAITMEDRKFLEEMRRSTQQEIAAILSPGEFEDYLVNNSDEAGDIRRHLGDVSVSDDEFRKLLKAFRDVSEKYGYFITDPAQIAEKTLDE